jgi:hypothetical protein
MAAKKTAKKKSLTKKTAKKNGAKQKTAKTKAPAKRAAARKAAANRVAKKKGPARKTAAPPRASKKPAAKPAPKKPPVSARVSQTNRRRQALESPRNLRGLGAGSAGQSGDLQGLPAREVEDSESVEELVEEGQGWEAAALQGVEEGDSPREVRTHEVPEDDVPEEYLNDGETDADDES